MATQLGVSTTPSKNIDEFLRRHPEVQTGDKAKVELETIHDTGDTFCVINKLFDNTILHQEYDGDSHKRVFAFVLVNDAEALERYEEDKMDDSDICDCKVGKEQGVDHYLHDHMVATEPDCKLHTGDVAPNPDCSTCWPTMSGSNCRM